VVKYIMGLNSERLVTNEAAVQLKGLQRKEPDLFSDCTMLVLNPFPGFSKIIFFNASAEQIAQIFAQLEESSKHQATS